MIKYSPDFIYSFRGCNGRKKLPSSAIKVLYSSSKIKKTMNKETEQNYEKNIDKYNKEEMEKQINSLLNKLSKENIQMISQKLNLVLKKRDILIEFTVLTILNKAIRMHLFIDTYIQLFTMINNEYSKTIFTKTFNNLLEKMKETNKEKIEDTSYDNFCKYLSNKDMFVGLFKFLASAYKSKIIEYQLLKDNIQYLQDKILKSTKDQNDIYGEVYGKFFKELNDKELIKTHIEDIKNIKNCGLLSMRIKFMMMDIEDILKQ